jgi:hypothetical protein
MKMDVTKIDYGKLVRTIGWIDTQDVSHSTADFIDELLENILAEYGISENWTNPEKRILANHMYDLALRDEFREAAMLADLELQPVI